MIRPGPAPWKPYCGTRLHPIVPGRQRGPESTQRREPGSKERRRVVTQTQCAGSGVGRSAFQPFQKRLSALLQTFLKAFCAVTIRARPGFGAVPVAAMLAVMSVSDTEQLKELLPVRTFLLQ